MRWLRRCVTPARLVMLAGALTVVSRFEQGLPGMVLALRAAGVIAVMAWLAACACARSGRRPVPVRLRGRSPGTLPG